MTTAALEYEQTAPLAELLEWELSRPDSTFQPESLDPRHLEASLAGPLRDFLQRPGKEFRARLVQTSWALAGGRGEPPPLLPWVVELLHSGSLIIDDIEDGSAYRRGAPALHVLHGLPVALNAGNWLYFWAFSLLERMELPAATELQLHRAMSRALLDCHRGQALDLTLRMGDLGQREVARAVEQTTALKTGCLLELAANLGALAANAGQERTLTLARFGRELGIALQMLDDLGGIFSESRAHKGHEDLLLGRPTWPWAWLAASVSETEYAALQRLARQVEQRDRHPEELAEKMREHLGSAPRRRVQQRVRRAFAQLKQNLGPSPALTQLSAEIARLERSYG
jgi:geranylgeranyl pyrophosphate synthase